MPAPPPSASTAHDLLFEIGCEELPASFVEGALRALPDLVDKVLSGLRLPHGAIAALGTPRRVAVLVRDVAAMQPDLEEEVMGPPVAVAFKDGAPTRAALAFADKVGCAPEALRRVDTPKGEYLAGTRSEPGQPARALLPAALHGLLTAIPFRKSMRWGTHDVTWGRPIRWLVALFGEEVLELSVAGRTSGRTSYGHRFLHPGPVNISSPGAYVDALRAAKVLVQPEERREAMRARLHEAAGQAGGTLIEDAFLEGENLSLVELPEVVAGRFDEVFLALPEQVILEVARGHQRYFGLRGPAGALLPRYLAVVNTAEQPEVIARGNDRVMRARLADARFFFEEDVKRPLADRRAALERVVFQTRLGSVLGKAERIERLAEALGAQLGVEPAAIEVATRGAHLCKCDLVTLMVGEFPELQGQVGRAYAEREGVDPAVAEVIASHYLPQGAHDDPPPNVAGALVAMADRLDTLAGCFGVGLSPTGTTDPYGLRRACIGVLRIAFERGLDLSVEAAVGAAYRGYEGVALDLSAEELTAKLAAFFRDRLRGMVADRLAGSGSGVGVTSAVNAALGPAADRPLDALARAEAILTLPEDVRAQVGEVFKRATNIAKDAPAGEPRPPAEIVDPVPASEQALWDAFVMLRGELSADLGAGRHREAFARLATFAPALGRYFDEVMVMHDDPALRDNRLRLMRAISDACRQLAHLELLGG